MVGRERVNDPCVETRFTERSLDRLMIDAGHLYGDDGVSQPFCPASLRNKLRHHPQPACGMLNRSRFDNHLAIEVAQHPFRAAFSAIDRNDAKVFRPDSLHALLNLPSRLPNKPFFRTRDFPFLDRCDHPSVSFLKVGQTPSVEALGRSLLLFLKILGTYQGHTRGQNNLLNRSDPFFSPKWTFKPPFDPSTVDAIAPG